MIYILYAFYVIFCSSKLEIYFLMIPSFLDDIVKSNDIVMVITME